MVGEHLYHVRVQTASTRRITGTVVNGLAEPVAVWAWQDDEGLRVKWTRAHLADPAPLVMETLVDVLQVTMARVAQDAAAEAPDIAPVTPSPVPSDRPSAGSPGWAHPGRPETTLRRPLDLEDSDAP